MLESKIFWALIVLSFFSLTGSVITTSDTSYAPLINAVCVGFITSVFFYIIVVYLPERKKKARIYKNLKRQYYQFKSSCISIFLVISHSQDYQFREMLLDQSEFKRYFKNNNRNAVDRWAAVSDGLESNEYYLDEILYELRLLNDEIKFVRGMIDIHDETVFQFLSNLSQIIHRMEGTKRDYEDVKSLSRFLWEIFSGFSFIDGQRKTDLIADMIERIDKPKMAKN